MHTEAGSKLDPHEQLVNEQNPWPGLSAFTEENAYFFHGREREADELFRLIKRETLTVLFGLSGLGKTSLLQAGIFHKLRREDFLPVYVRLSYVEGAPDLVTQVKETVREACSRADISAPPIRAGETLWANFHRTANEFKTQEGRTITPVMIFDQFEEMFTLGSGSDECRSCITELLAQLSDLIENRPPKDIEKLMDDEGEETFSFTKSHYKVVFTLREDFLANLESLCNQLPSISHNRFRLQKMNGQQAFEVVKAGGSLVDTDVAEKIVKIVAGRDADARVPLTALEIEPTLLSVFCRELNNKRIANGDARITTQLLSGSKEVILTGFYERALTGFGEKMRYFIEDRLLTGFGYRNSVDLGDALTLPGVSRDGITTLINRRLLRIEDSGRSPRVELTHDVLTDVIKKSRDERKTREEARAAEERARLAAEEIRAKDEELHRAKRRNFFLTGVTILAVACFFFSWYELGVAQQNEKLAEGAKQTTVKEDDQAAKTIEQTLSDLDQKLVQIGRVDLLEHECKQALDLLSSQAKAEGNSMTNIQEHCLESIHQTLGDAYFAENKIDDALTEYNQSLGTARQLARSSRSDFGDSVYLSYQKDRAILLSGPPDLPTSGGAPDCYLRQGDYKTVTRFYDESLEDTQKLQAESGDPKDQLWVTRQLANVYGRQAMLLVNLGHAQDALAKARQGLDAANELVAHADPKDPLSDYYQIDLSNALFRFGYVSGFLGHNDDARTSFEQSLAKRKAVVDKRSGSDELTWLRSLYFNYMMIGNFQLQHGELDSALQSLQTGLDTDNRVILANPSVLTFRGERSFGTVRLSYVYRAKGDWDHAVQSNLDALSDLQKLCDEDKTSPGFQNFLALCQISLADSLFLAGKPDTKLGYYDAAQQELEKIVSKHSDNASWQRNLGLALSRKGYALNLPGPTHDVKAADFLYSQAHKAFSRALEHDSGSPDNYNTLAWLLATCPLDDIRKGYEQTAVNDALKACELNAAYWEYIDTLAAAEASAGKFKEAVADELRAIAAVDPTDKVQIARMTTRLELYQKGLPFHDPTPINYDR